MTTSISPQMFSQISDVAANGSPVLVSAAGRLLGFGQDEQTALAAGKIPPWLWMTAFIVGGVVIGVRVQKAWPKTLPSWVTGGKKS